MFVGSDHKASALVCDDCREPVCLDRADRGSYRLFRFLSDRLLREKQAETVPGKQSALPVCQWLDGFAAVRRLDLQ